MIRFLGLVFLLSLIWSCGDTVPSEVNPPAPGFNAEESDQEAIAIADKVMKASGGREVWDSTDYFQWRFFGNRLHVWNKETGDVIISSEKDSFRIEMNVRTMEGEVIMKGEEVTEPGLKDSLLQNGKEYWINDSYWVFLPFKLKDSGVTLKYLGEGESAEGVLCHQLQLTFEEVGVTPDNKYIVYVDKGTNLVTQWDFYTNFTDEEPRFSTPWTNYEEYEGLKLSSGRGGDRGMQDLKVGASLADQWD